MHHLLTTPDDKTDYTQVYRDELAELSLPGRLSARLSAMDRERPLQRIFVMGCGRSGTWLLTGVMSTFQDVFVHAAEVPVELFGVLSTSCSTLVLKRNYISFATIEQIPTAINLLHIIRHPYDVLTSYHPKTRDRYHITPERWSGEMEALRKVRDTRRPHTTVVRYEDLVRDPQSVQAELADSFNLKVSVPADAFTSTFSPSPKALASMDAMRPIGTQSVARYKTDPAHIAYLRGVTPQLGPTLDWVAQEFGYDIAL